MPKMNSPVVMVGEPTERVKEVMRAMREEADRYLEEYRQLAPRYGEIAAGSEHVRAFLKSECLAWYLMRMMNGEGKGEPDFALKSAKIMGRLIAKTWNNRREYQVHIWEETFHDRLDHWHRRILEAMRKG